MPIAALALLLLLPLALIALTPLLLVQRYRAGRTRRLARPWAATLNLAAMIVSVAFFLAGAAMTNFWVPAAFVWSVGGLAIGCALGAVGLRVSRWEATPRSLHYTPNHWLVLVVTFLVAGRVIYGFWRGWMSLDGGADTAEVLAALGVEHSLAAGATVLGYYLAYGIGVRRRVSQWQKRPLRVIH